MYLRCDLNGLIEMTKNDIAELTEPQVKCLHGIVRYFFGQNRDQSTYEEISESFYRPTLLSLVFNPEMKTKKESDFPMPLLKGTIRELTSRGFIVSLPRTNNLERYELSQDFVTLAQQIYLEELDITGSKANRKSETLFDQTTEIPASDRFVSLDHNSRDFNEAIETLEKIADRVEKSNELIADKAQRLAIIREVNGLKELIQQPSVRAVTIWHSIKGSGVLAWLTVHGSDAVLNALAVEAVGHMLKIFGWN